MLERAADKALQLTCTLPSLGGDLPHLICESNDYLPALISTASLAKRPTYHQSRLAMSR